MNIWYDPEKFGLKVVGTLSIPMSYEFSYFVVWSGRNGELFWGTDSGCSCPTPFEYTGVDDLHLINDDSWSEFEKAVNDFNVWRGDEDDDYLAADKTELLAKVSGLLRSQMPPISWQQDQYMGERIYGNPAYRRD